MKDNNGSDNQNALEHEPQSLDSQAWSLETQAIRVGQLRTDEGSHGEPIYTTSSFVFDSAEHAKQRFAGEEKGNIYSRFTNPTVRSFEQRLAALEGGERAVGTASGMAAILCTCMGLLECGDHVVASRSLFGTTVVLFEKFMQRFGVQTTFVDLTDIDAWSEAITAKTKMFFLETPSNPLSEIADIAALAELARPRGILVVVDNCFCTPALQQPLALGADIVTHSATKYLDGQGRSIGGAVVGSEALMESVLGVVRTCGPTLSSFNAWIALKGLETLSLRMKAHSDAALALAQWLETQPQIEKVHYAGLVSHPQHELAASQQRGFGGVLSFVVKGGQPAAWQVIDATQVMSITANLGDVKTTITHPATTTHIRLSDEARIAAGIEPGLVRVSVGLENLEDLQADLLRGFHRV